MTTKDIIPPSPSQETYAVDEDQGEVFTIHDPFAQFAEWMMLARENEINDPNAMALATVDEGGLPNVRMVLLKDFDACGLTFYTNTQSAKGTEVAARPVGALCFHWKSIRRQVRFRGLLEPVSAEEADAYFAQRARGAQLGAIASRQSRKLEDRSALEAAIAELDRDHAGQDIPRPDYWSGFLLKPVEIEFWVNRPFRLHDRRVYRRKSTNEDWIVETLYP